MKAIIPESMKKIEGAAGNRNSGPDYGELVALLLARLFTAALACYGLFHPLFFAWLEVKGMTLNFLDNVLLLDLALKAPQGVLKGFSLLNSDFGQTGYTT